MAVGRILVQMDKFGMLDKTPKHSITEEDNAFNAPIVQKTGEDSATLLKNEGAVLPLTTADLASVVFIGPTAGQLVSIGQSGERAMGIPEHLVGPVAAVEKVAGRKVTYAVANDFDGTPIPVSALSNNGKPGLVRTNTGNNQTQTDAELNFTTSNGKALQTGTSYTWKGTLTAPGDGAYTIAFQSRGSTGAVTLDGQALVSAGGGGRGGAGGAAAGTTSLMSAPEAAYRNRRGMHPIAASVVPTKDLLNNARARIELKAGVHELLVTTTGEPNGDAVQVRLAWVTPQQEKANYAAAIAAAKQAKKAIVFAWGRDRPEVFQLPGGQNQLIEDIAAVNSNTVVVLNTSLPVAMPWAGKVKGILQMWWPGDEGGPATANILLGKANPAGRLPVTWPVKLEDMVANDPAKPERTSAGVNAKTTYSEGIFVGYRWFDQQGKQPLFPFGHGLSYTTFQYSGIKVARAKDGGLDVSFSVKNTGKAAGDEVAQVYLGAPKSAPGGAQFAVKALAQFDRVSIPAGQTKALTLHVEPRRLQYWATATNRWETAAGSRTVYVGASSRDIRLQAEANIAR
jgi:beta-glucosidase